ncbi:MAG: hypothetical protein EOM05_09465 [Clostridia bacterium]|nr:hypothetical protein [Clostridia bacterium]
MLGCTSGNGHPYSWSAIFNNYVYIPALDSGTMRISSIIFGAVCCVVYVVLTILGNVNKKKKVIILLSFIVLHTLCNYNIYLAISLFMGIHLKIYK